jgi:N-acetylglucosaminyldiphosphoundecaprenol N-acetyl-beta-D-mannosaminyltransferase
MDSHGAHFLTTLAAQIPPGTRNSTAVDAPSATPRIQLLGLPLDAITESQAIQFITTHLQNHRGGWVITPNLDHLRRFTSDPEFASFFSQADLVLCDGMPLVWAGKLQGTPLPQRVAGSDLIWSLSAAAADRAIPIYLLGGEPGAAEGAAQVLQEKFPALEIVGVHSPAIGFENDPASLEAIIENLRQSKPGIIFVALGSPKQEQLIARIRHILPTAWWIGVGISFSFVSGEIKRAPLWMRRRGMEWIHRLTQEPRRLARRYLVDNLPFVRMLFLNALWNRLTNRALSPAPKSTAAIPARQFMSAVDWSICLLLVLLAHSPLVAFGIMRLWEREAYQFFPIAWTAASIIAFIRICGTSFGRPGRLNSTILFLIGGLALLTAVIFWSWTLGTISLLLNILALAYDAGGLPLFRALLPACLIFLTTLPPPFALDDSILTALRGIAINWSSRVLDSIGVLHVISGNLIEIPGRRLFIAEACSGINSTMSSLSFAVTCAMFMRRNILHAVFLASLAILFAIAGNVFRIALGTALIEWFNYDIITDWQHETVGLLIFAMSAALIISADRLLVYLLAGIRGTRPRFPASFNWQRPGWPVKSLIGAYLALGVTAVLFIAPHIVWHWPSAGFSNLPATAQFALPDQIGPWKQIPAAPDLTAETTGKKSQLWSYSDGTARVIIALDYPFMAYHDLTECYLAQGWTMVARNSQSDTIGPLDEVRITRPGAAATLLFTLEDERGRWLASSRTESIKDKFLKRMVFSGRVESDPRPSYQMQALLPEGPALTSSQRIQVSALFREIRQALSRQLMTQLPNSH